MREHLGQRTDIEVVDALVEVGGRTLLDIGCASGIAARLLVAEGASVVGIEPDPVQAKLNREAERPEQLTLMHGHAEALPQGDDSVDGALFFRSLHHVPLASMDVALEEARRVVRPGGFVMVLEPCVEGRHTALMLPFHDEREVRGAAQRALDRAQEGFGDRRQYTCAQSRTYESFEQMSTHFSSVSFENLTRERIEVPEVREAFEAGKTQSGYVFDQPLLVDLFRVA